MRDAYNEELYNKMSELRSKDLSGITIYKEVGDPDESRLLLLHGCEEFVKDSGKDETYGYLCLCMEESDDNFQGGLYLERHTVVKLVEALQSYLKDFPE